jgi:hypothetical protein
MHFRMAPSHHNNQSFHPDVPPANFLGQRQQNVQRYIDGAGGELGLELAAFGPDGESAAGDTTHELCENGGLQRIAHADDEALGRGGRVEPALISVTSSPRSASRKAHAQELWNLFLPHSSTSPDSPISNTRHCA